MKISVIIPAYNEAASIEATLKYVLEQKPDEILVVDGGSEDETAAHASQWARVVPSAKGRARQLNEGARAATGDLFLFLHADTELPQGAIESIRKAIGEGRCEAGRFRMRFDEGHLLTKLYTFYTRFQFFSYGDQGFFVTREIFNRLGGFREDHPFEDIDFYQRLRKVTRPLILPLTVTTSARRFRGVGRFRQKWINLWLVTLYYMGFNIVPLKEKLYRDVR